MALHTRAPQTREKTAPAAHTDSDSTVAPARPADPRRRRRMALGLLAFVVLTAGLLLWSKWWPYAGKVNGALQSRTWDSPAALDSAARAGEAPSLADAWTFTLTYAAAVWKAWVAGLLIAAAASVLVPRTWLLRGLGRRGGPGREAGGVLAGGLLGTVMLMCTACAAPVTASLRRDGARSSATLAYLYANPVLNPAVLAILALVGPWQWVTTRIVVGLVLVLGFTLLIGRLVGEEPSAPTSSHRAVSDRTPVAQQTGAAGAAPLGRAFLRRLVLLTVTLTPIYAVVVFVQGWFRGWVFPLEGQTAMVLALAIAVVLGTVIDLPTAGEIPVVLALSAAGLGTAATGALLVTLPAVSLVTLAMIWRSHGRRTTVLAGAAVMVAGVLGAGLLSILAA